MNNEQQLKSILSELPAYASDYFDYAIGTLDHSLKTMIGYAYDIKSFYNFLLKSNPTITNINAISVDTLNKLTPKDIQEYMSYLRSYENNDNKTTTNQGSSRARKLSSLRSYMQYLFIYDDLKINPAKLIDSPKVHKKKQPRLNTEELSILMQHVSTGNGLSSRQMVYTQNSTYRDLAIIGLLSGTGIRVSELVNLNLKDIDMKNKTIKVLRKGGNEDIVYPGDVVLSYINDYIELERDDAENNPALFLSSRGKSRNRLTVRSVERIVKKFGNTIPSVSKVTPHTLRRTFGTELYNNTGDIYMVADALGHKNVQVTADHYTEIHKDRKEMVREISDKILK